jgi:hypothetical protein
MQNVAKFKNKDVTGVFAVQCARHQFFEPGGMVDLQKGERQVQRFLRLYVGFKA